MAGSTPPTPRDRDLPLAGLRVLVADDEPLCRTLAADALAAAGAEVHQVADGREAVLRAAAVVPDLLVTDLAMPELDGLQAAAILRWDFGLRELPIVVLSTEAPPASDLLACGVNACLPKPIVAADLVGAVRSCLAAAPAAPRADSSVPTEPAFDADEALARMDGREDLLAQLVTIFLADHEGTPARVTAAVDADDRAEAERLCHALGGTGGSVGAARVHVLAREMARKLREGRLPARPELAALSAAVGAASRAMERWLATPRRRHLRTRSAGPRGRAGRRGPGDAPTPGASHGSRGARSR